MKSVFKNRKTYTFLAISLFLFFNILSLNPGMAIYMHDEGATFHLDKEDPLAYGVFLPEPNMYATLSIQGSNQGEFSLMWFEGMELASEIVDQPGDDISFMYPWYFDDCISTVTNNDFVDPIMNTFWLNVSAYNAENETLSPYNINTVYNYYVMNEEGKLQIPLNHSIPMQIDITINNLGPKILKYDWLTDDPGNIDETYNLVSPTGKRLNIYRTLARSFAVSPSVRVFEYFTFVANEIGTYRLLVCAEHVAGLPAYLNLEFLSSSISSLPLEKLIFGGNSEDILAIEETEHSTWQSNWFRINGEKGDLLKLDLNKDYTTGVEPLIGIWSPCENGYLMLDLGIGEGTHDIYFPTKGYAYISFVDANYGDWYRYSLYLSEYETLDYTIGGNLTSVKISRDQRKAIEFSLEEDSFVRFNFTSTPPGNPYLYSMDLYGMETVNGTIFMDSKTLNCYQVISPLDQKIANNEWFHYYYMPAGNYKAMIKNSNITTDGVLQISSKFVEVVNETIPVNSLIYPDLRSSQFFTFDFEPDEYYNRLKQGICIEINITEPGQYILNTTIYASDNLAAIPLTADPAAIVVYNSSGDNYLDWTEEALDPLRSFPAFSNDTVGDQTDDILFIASTQKWHNMEFNFSQPGSKDHPALNIDFFVYDGIDFTSEVTDTLDTTDEFTLNGTIALDIDENDYANWVSGADFDLPNINEANYYWLAIELVDRDYDPLPFIQLLTLSNITLQGDLNFALIRDSGYNFGDFWRPTDQPAITGLVVNQGLEYVEDSDYTHLLEADSPYILGFEEGTYKLLIIPEKWSYSGPVTIHFAIENYWPYRHQETYNITALTPNPQLHKFQINNYTSYGYANGTGPFYDYGLAIQYNDTEASVPKFAGNSYFLLECYGEAYQWTQLVVSTNNVSSYSLYLLQDLPWSYNAPNWEVITLGGGFINDTHEFGVHTDQFYLLFEVDDLAEIITFRLALSQYDTVELFASPPTASYKPPLDTSLIIILAIVIPAAIGGAIVVVYILKKKRGGKI